MRVNFEVAASFGVDRESRRLTGATVMQAGAVNDSRPWIVDETTLSQVQAGLEGRKARFGHRNGEGSFLGTWSNVSSDGERTRGDLAVSSVADKSPTFPNLGEYVLDLASEASATFGVSVAGELDMVAMREQGSGGSYPIRFAAIHAADIVDDPAATRGGLFDSQTSDELEGLLKEADMPTQKEFDEFRDDVTAKFDVLLSKLEPVETETPPPAEEPEPVADLGTLDAETETIDSHTLDAWVRRFGAERGSQYVLQGVTFEQALQLELKHITEERDAAKAELSTAADELNTLKASLETDYVTTERHDRLLRRYENFRKSLGEQTPAEFSEAEPPKTREKRDYLPVDRDN